MRFSRSGLVVCLPILLMTAETARAGLFMAMQPLGRHEVLSKNGHFVLEVDPDTGRNNVYRADDRTRPVWTFSGVLKTDVRKILLADNGSVVALIGGGDVDQTNLSKATGVRMIDRFGETLTYRIVELNRNPSFSFGCGGNQAIWIDEITDHGDRFVIRTTEGEEHTFDYSTVSRSMRLYKAAAATVIAGVGLIALLVRLAARRPVAGAPITQEA